MTTQLSATCVDEILAAADEIGLPAGRVALAAADLRCALVRPLDPEVVERHVRVLEREATRLQRRNRNPRSATVSVARTGAGIRRKGLVATAILACGLFTTGGLAAAGLIDGTPRSIVESVADQLGLEFSIASGNEPHDEPHGHAGEDGADLPRRGNTSTSSTPAHTTPHISGSPATAAEPATHVPAATAKQRGAESPGNADSNAGTPNLDTGNPNPDTPNPDTGNPNPDTGNPNPDTPNPGNPHAGNGNGNPNPGNSHAGNGTPNAGDVAK